MFDLELWKIIGAWAVIPICLVIIGKFVRWYLSNYKSKTVEINKSGDIYFDAQMLNILTNLSVKLAIIENVTIDIKAQNKNILELLNKLIGG